MLEYGFEHRVSAKSGQALISRIRVIAQQSLRRSGLLVTPCDHLRKPQASGRPTLYR